jgi:type 1 glutamine amidotransferase
VLVFNTPPHLMEKDPHKGYCIPYGAAAMRVLGEKTGAFEAVVSDDLTMFMPDQLRRFDAVVLNNASGSWITPSEATMQKLGRTDPAAVEQTLKASILDWVSGGGGIVAYHYALGANSRWPEFHEMMGAVLGGHPWNEDVGVKVEDPQHPIVAAFEGKGFRIADELFQFSRVYDRSKVRVLLSLDNDVTNMSPANYTLRADRDFPMAYVKSHGKGRIFYTVFGHRTEIYWHPQVLRMYLDGIQFATGDLEAPTEPLEPGRIAPARAPAPTPRPARGG